MSGQDDSSGYAAWTPPVYNMNSDPRRLYATHLRSRRESQDGTEDRSVFARMAKWCVVLRAKFLVSFP